LVIYSLILAILPPIFSREKNGIQDFNEKINLTAENHMTEATSGRVFQADTKGHMGNLTLEVDINTCYPTERI